MGPFWRQEQTREYSQVCKSLMMLLVEKTRIEKWVSLSQNIDVAGTVGRVKTKRSPKTNKMTSSNPKSHNGCGLSVPIHTSSASVYERLHMTSQYQPSETVVFFLGKSPG